MKENRYDDQEFFEEYKRMPRSVYGLAAAGEWHELQRLLPDLKGKRVLDIGCGFGWHCRYAADQGAVKVVGTDISEKMLSEARSRTQSTVIEYVRTAAEDIHFPDASFDVIISSLVFHYVATFAEVCRAMSRILKEDGVLVCSFEHPVFTAEGAQEWICDEQGMKEHWPVDRYFIEGWRDARFLGHTIRKYHRTLTTYMRSLFDAGFGLTALVEPMPPEEMMRDNLELREELRRPMMVLISARKSLQA